MQQLGDDGVADRVAQRLQVVGELGGCNLMGLPKDWSGDSFHYLGGIRWTPVSAGRWSYHLQLLAGGEKITHEKMFPQKKALLYEKWKAGGSIPDEKPEHSEYTIGSEANAFALQTGFGLSYRMNSALQWKLASFEYKRSWLPVLDGLNYRNSLTFTTGINMRMGSW